MTEQEKLAREWADYAKNVAVSSPEQQAAADFILAHTAPPTMEDVEWDDKEHHGQGAVGEDGVEWIMVDMRPDRRIVGISPDFRKVRGLRPEWLTPNGKRYELREVADDQQDHPKVLRTVEDYENAPNGTVVACRWSDPWTKDGSRQYPWVRGDEKLRDTDMAHVEREVLRWGWGE